MGTYLEENSKQSIEKLFSEYEALCEIGDKQEITNFFKRIKAALGFLLNTTEVVKVNTNEGQKYVVYSLRNDAEEYALVLVALTNGFDKRMGDILESLDEPAFHSSHFFGEDLKKAILQLWRFEEIAAALAKELYKSIGGKCTIEDLLDIVEAVEEEMDRFKIPMDNVLDASLDVLAELYRTQKGNIIAQELADYQEIRKIPTVDTLKKASYETICNGETEHWDNRAEALAYYRGAMKHSQGEVLRNYKRIFMQLWEGAVYCSDDILPEEIKVCSVKNCEAEQYFHKGEEGCLKVGAKEGRMIFATREAAWITANRLNLLAIMKDMSERFKVVEEKELTYHDDVKYKPYLADIYKEKNLNEMFVNVQRLLGEKEYQPEVYAIFCAERGKRQNLGDILYDAGKIVFDKLSGGFCNVPRLDVICGDMQDVEATDHVYLFNGGLHERILLADVAYKGKIGIMMYKISCSTFFPKAESETIRGEIKTELMLYETVPGISKRFLKLWDGITDYYKMNIRNKTGLAELIYKAD